MEPPTPQPRLVPAAVAPPEEAQLARVCAHCETPLVADQKRYCCMGCQVVHQALVSAGLTRYYALRDHGVPVGDTATSGERSNWVAPLQAKIETGPEPTRLSLQLQGVRCAACVWLLEQVFQRAPGRHNMDLNPASGALTLHVTRAFDLGAFVDQVRSFGYQIGEATDDPEREAARRQRDGLLLRAGLATVCALNAMFFAAAIYFGLESGSLYRLLHGLNFACATLAVLLGAPVFISSSLRALRMRLLHLDLPIAVGITVSYAAAAWSYFAGQDASAYYDSLAVFVALMLWGRYLQDHLVASNRERLLADRGTVGLTARRYGVHDIDEIPVEEIAPGDRLVVPVGDMLLVAAALQQDTATCALDAMDGEAVPRSFDRGELIPAGAVNVGERSLTVVAREPFTESAALPLLRSASPDRYETDVYAQRGMSRFAGAYVIGVLTMAFGGLWATLSRGGSSAEALGIATAVCVVTCPCSIGIALPLAREAVHRKLWQAGLFVRSPSFLQRAGLVNRIAFDKTGTLTDGHLHLANPEALASLDLEARQVLLSMVGRSSHPRSRALQHALRASATHAPILVHDLETTELAGSGLQASWHGRTYRLGSADFAGRGADSDDAVFFARDGLALARFRLTEQPRPAAAAELARLRKLGYRLHVISGDQVERVKQLASHLGLSPQDADGRMSPQDKLRWVRSHDPSHTLMLGDGLNDNLALEAAGCAGTPAVSRSSVCARSDFYYTSAGFAPITSALLAARDMRRITQRNWAFLAIYNTLAVATALSGLMKPLLAAVIMPVSSIVSITLTLATLRRWSHTWKS